MAKNEILGWWFGDGSGRLPRNDGRKIIIGATHTIEGDIVPCERGLHASPTVFDALRYAPGPYLYRVRLSGIVMPHGEPIVDKYAASERTYLDGDDATPLLRWFARVCAAGVLKYWDAPQVVRDYLISGDESLRTAARIAAGTAAWDAAWATARDAARAAAWDAARATQRKWLEAGALQWFDIEPHALDDLIAATKAKS